VIEEALDAEWLGIVKEMLEKNVSVPYREIAHGRDSQAEGRR
jgi:hypothetical protein